MRQEFLNFKWQFLKIAIAKIYILIFSRNRVYGFAIFFEISLRYFHIPKCIPYLLSFCTVVVTEKSFVRYENKFVNGPKEENVFFHRLFDKRRKNRLWKFNSVWFVTTALKCIVLSYVSFLLLVAMFPYLTLSGFGLEKRSRLLWPW